jgi:hypothetical protein
MLPWLFECTLCTSQYRHNSLVLMSVLMSKVLVINTLERWFAGFFGSISRCRKVEPPCTVRACSDALSIYWLWCTFSDSKTTEKPIQVKACCTSQSTSAHSCLYGRKRITENAPEPIQFCNLRVSLL